MYRYTVKWITIFIALSLSYSLSAQVKGNKNIVSKSYDIHGLKNIEIGLYANITINAQGDDKMTITADENILPLIDHEIVDGKMDLRQKEWIEGNERIEINMEVSSLERIIVNIHEDVKHVVDKHPLLEAEVPEPGVRDGARLGRADRLDGVAKHGECRLTT